MEPFCRCSHEPGTLLTQLWKKYTVTFKEKFSQTIIINIDNNAIEDTIKGDFCKDVVVVKLLSYVEKCLRLKEKSAKSVRLLR